MNVNRYALWAMLSAVALWAAPADAQTVKVRPSRGIPVTTTPDTGATGGGQTQGAARIGGATGVANAAQSAGVLRASQLLGLGIRGQDGNQVGTVQDLILDPVTRNVQYVMFGSGQNVSEFQVMPWQLFSVEGTGDGRFLTTTVPLQTIHAAPTFTGQQLQTGVNWQVGVNQAFAPHLQQLGLLSLDDQGNFVGVNGVNTTGISTTSPGIDPSQLSRMNPALRSRTAGQAPGANPFATAPDGRRFPQAGANVPGGEFPDSRLTPEIGDADGRLTPEIGNNANQPGAGTGTTQPGLTNPPTAGTGTNPNANAAGGAAPQRPGTAPRTTVPGPSPVPRIAEPYGSNSGVQGPNPGNATGGNVPAPAPGNAGSGTPGTGGTGTGGTGAGGTGAGGAGAGGTPGAGGAGGAGAGAAGAGGAGAGAGGAGGAAGGM